MNVLLLPLSLPPLPLKPTTLFEASSTGLIQTVVSSRSFTSSLHEVPAEIAFSRVAGALHGPGAVGRIGACHRERRTEAVRTVIGPIRPGSPLAPGGPGAPGGPAGSWFGAKSTLSSERFLTLALVTAPEASFALVTADDFSCAVPTLLGASARQRRCRFR